MSKFVITKNAYLPHWFNAGLFAIALILSLNIPFSKDDWKDLTDPYDYLHQSKLSLLDKEFYFPHKTDDFDPRPFTVPLFYKLFNSNPAVLVQMQRVALFFSGFFLLTALLLSIEKSSSKYFLILSVYLLLSWWNVQGWATLVLSEALSMALLFCWLASLLLLYKKESLRWLLLHASITFLFAFTRDSWPYVLMAFYAGVCVFGGLLKKSGIKKYAALLTLSIGIFLVQQAAARIGERSKLPVINSIVVRILPNSDYTQWFVEHGMPCAEKLRQNFDGIDVVPEAGQHRLWALYTDTAYQPFLNWVLEKGQPTYTRFLLTHPGYLFLIHESPAQRSRIMSHDLFYIDTPRGYSVYFQPLFPLFNPAMVVVLCIVLVMFYRWHKTPVLLAPVFLALFTLLNAILSYNADALEVERHLFITNILVQLTGFLAITFIWDTLAWKRNE